MTLRILIVDDDPHIRDVLCFAIEKAGMKTIAARNGVEALRCFDHDRPDMLILDVGMPEMDGLEVCRRVRAKSDVPILFLSARDEEIDRVLGLEIGGDDYVTKPFSPRELIARIKVILKRSQASEHIQTRCSTSRPLARGALVLDPDAHTVSFGDKPVAITAIEIAILRALLSRPGLVFSRQQILDAVYGPTYHLADRTIDSHVRNIRSKLALVGCDAVIETVHGVGFRIGPCEARS